eukprot:g1300.t1
MSDNGMVTTTTERDDGKKKRKVVKKPGVEEKALEEMLFGSGDVEEEERSIADEKQVKNVEGNDFVDDDENDRTESDANASTSGPAWVDDDDEEVRVDIAAAMRTRKLRTVEGSETLSGREYADRLRARFKNTGGSQGWAEAALKRAKSAQKKNREKSDEASARKRRKRKKTEDDDDSSSSEEDDFVTQSTSNLLEDTTREGSRRGQYLRQQRIEMKRLVDANIKGRSDAVVRAVEFHPRRSILLTGGFDRKLRLFEIDGRDNNLIQSVVLSDMPIHRAYFSGSEGSEILCTGRRPFFYYYDLVAGRVVKVPRIAGPHKQKSLENFAVSPNGEYIAFLGADGYLVICSGKTKKWLFDMKMNGSVRSASFSPNSQELFTIGGDGEVYRWSMRTRRCIGRHVDEGNLSGTSISVAPSGKRYAVGSSSGVVNIYDAQAAARATAARVVGADVPPLKAVMNLTTPIDRICFNHDSQIMAISSQRIQDAMKLVHVPSMTTFANWPTTRTPLGFVTSMSFSAQSGHLAVGNHKGKVLLYGLGHYARV